MIQNDESALCARPTTGSTVAVALRTMSSSGESFVSVAFAAQPRDAILDVTVRSSRVSLKVRGAPLADVLGAIGRQAGVKVVLRDALRTSVTATLINVPIEEAIRRLGRWHSIVLIYDQPTDRAGRSALSEVWVTCPDADAASGLARGVVSAAAGASGEDAGAKGQSLSEPERWARALIAVKDASPEIRNQQIGALVSAHGEPAIVAALRQIATRDPAPRARRAAIQVLASMGTRGAIEAVRAALADTNPGVRSEANTALGRRGRGRPRSGEGPVD
jgi:HEAT repeats